MPGRHCCVNGCYNGDNKLKKWRSQLCVIHSCNFGTGRCTCDPPFKLLTFPTESQNKYARNIWIRNINRQSQSGELWLPNNDSRICSNHFVDLGPTPKNPYPTLHMGHMDRVVVGRQPPKDRCLEIPTKKRKSTSNDCHSDSDVTNNVKSHLIDHDYLEYCDTCLYKEEEIRKFKNQIRCLTLELNDLKKKTSVNVQNQLKSRDMLSLLVNDRKVKFYTGIPTKSAFNAVYNAIQPSLKNVRYWKGPSYHCTTLKHKKFQKNRACRKLNPKEEMLLTFMKIRLGLLDEDLADRFQISLSYVSRIFTTWVKLLKRYLSCLVFNAQKDVVRHNLPPSFRTTKYSQVRHIIDCSEVFIEKPQNLVYQNQCWSDYKHHHTAKFLLSINPSGMINFVSECWGGRTSDKHITLHLGFMDLIEPFDCIMADKGFSNLLQDFTLLHATLLTPPGKHGVSQMPANDVRKTKEIANRRIFVEQAIRRMKYFRILKFEIPLTLCQHLDDIVRIVSGVCNMYPPLPKY